MENNARVHNFQGTSQELDAPSTRRPFGRLSKNSVLTVPFSFPITTFSFSHVNSHRDTVQNRPYCDMLCPNRVNTVPVLEGFLKINRAVILCLAAALALFAQGERGTFNGTVTDPSGAAVAG